MVAFIRYDQMLVPKMPNSNPRSEYISDKKIAHVQYSSAITSAHSLALDCDEEPCLQQNLNLMDERRQKRMISNRESAKRSRMKKQRHVDDLLAQLAQLRSDNSVLLSNINVGFQNYMMVEAENRALRSVAMDLSAKLQALQTVLEQADGSKKQRGHVMGCGLHSDFTPIVGDLEMEKMWLPQNLKAQEIHH